MRAQCVYQDDATKRTERKMTNAVETLAQAARAKIADLGPQPAKSGIRVSSERREWDAASASIGRDFLLAVWEAAKSGDNVCVGYINYQIDGAMGQQSLTKPMTDERVAAYAESMGARTAYVLTH
jgi:hypothetical protein